MSELEVWQLRPRFLPDRDAPKEWGGKGSVLARLVRKGFRVPPMACMGLGEVEGWLKSLPEYAPAIESWRMWSSEASVRMEALRQVVLAAPMPEHWSLSTETIRRLLCGDLPGEPLHEGWPLIFRSNMSLGGGLDSRMAGCFESVVVRDLTPSGLWKGFAEVVASAFKLSSAERLLATGSDPRAFKPGVLIQPYLHAELAGVCFSRSPENPWSRDGRVEWVKGGGENLVQGSGESWSRKRSEGAAQEVAPFWEELWKRAEKLEAIVGGASELEWVWDGEQLWIVQARTVATVEARLAARSPERRWTRALTLERFPEPITAMGWSMMKDVLVANLRTLDRRFGVVAKSPEEVAVSVRGTIYLDPEFLSFPSGVRVRWWKHLQPFQRGPWLLALSGVRAMSRWIAGRGGAASRALFRLDLLDALVGAQAVQIEQDWDAHREQSRERLGTFNAMLPASLVEPREILERIRALTSIRLDDMEPGLAIFLIKDSIHKALLGLSKALGFEEVAYADLFRSSEGNRTQQMNSEWNQLVDALSRDAGHPAFFSALDVSRSSVESERAAAVTLTESTRARWSQFLKHNGHLTTSWDVSVPTWSEDPSRIAALLRASVSASWVRGQSAAKPINSGRLEFESALKAGLGATESRRVLRAFDRLESFMRMDEDQHFCSGALLGPSRALLLVGGRVLVEHGLLEREEDVFFLRSEELFKALESPRESISFKVLARRREAEWRRAYQAATPFDLPEPAALVSALPSGELSDHEWQGSPMSPGKAEGRAIVVEHLDQVQGIEPGAILITTSPHLALTPIYPLLGGMISATGSLLSHGFVSARECQLPAVSRVLRATHLIRSGAWVRLDGGTGRVEVVTP